MKTTLGIDPGAKGAACFLKDDEVYFIDWEDNLNLTWSKLLQAKQEHKPKIALLERVRSRPNQGTVSTFTFGTNYGNWQAWLTALEIPYIEQTPQAWMSGLLPRKKGKKDAKRALDVALKLFPYLADELVGPRGGIKDGRVDALLMAYQARKEL